MTISFGFLPQLSYRARRFLALIDSLVFLFFLPSGWEVFYLVTNSYTPMIYTFGGANAKEKSNCNAKVTRPRIT